MNKLTKKIGPAEVKCRCVTIPSDKRHVFPLPGTEFDLIDGNTTHRAKLDNQFRLRSATWFRQHRGMKAGDEINFMRKNGTVQVSFARLFSKPEHDTFEWTREVLTAIENQEIDGVLRIDRPGFTVEIGEQIAESQIIFKPKGTQAS